MTARRLLTISRIIVAVLLLNIASSAVWASASDNSQYTWMCTSQGLVKVSLEADSEPDNASNLQASHCVYCKLIDQPVDLPKLNLGYPQPDVALILDYNNPQARMSLQPILSSVQLRAPPLLTS